MRQVGVLAAAGLLALDTMVERLAEDHEHARLLADALARCRGARPAPTRTNIAVAELDARDAEAVVARLRERGVLASALGTATLRLVTHRDVTRADCERAAAVLLEVLGQR
jgi:threonine aldolase